MKHMKIILPVVACALAFSLMLVGCSGNKQGSEGAPAGGTSTEADGGAPEFYTLEEGAPEILSAYMYLTPEDNSAMLVVGDWGYEGTWKQDGANITLDLGEEVKPVTLRKDGDKLVLGKDDGSRLVFVPGNEEAFFADQGAVEGDGAEGAVEEVPEAIEDIEPVAVADDANCTITVTGKGTDTAGDPVYRLSVVNKTGKTFYLYAGESFKVGDKEVENYGTTGVSIEPNATTEEQIYFAKDELGGGAEKLTGVSGEIVLADFDTDEDVATYKIQL